MAAHYDNIVRDLNNKVYHPVYFLHGDESFFIDALTDRIENQVLSGTEKEFNQTVVYGRELEILELITMARRYPMMSNYQVIIVKEAQDIKDLVPRSDSKTESPLIGYLERPQPTTILVLCYRHKSIDKRTRLAKMLVKHAVCFESSRLSDTRIPAWISTFVKEKGYRIGADASQLLGEYAGNDLTRIVHELEKLFLHIEKGGIVDFKLIEQYIGISKEFNVFELQNALGGRDIVQANRIINYMASNEKNNPMVLTLGSLFNYFNKLLTYHFLSDKSDRHAASALGVPPFYLRGYAQAARRYKPEKLVEIVSLLRDYDLKSKGVNNETTRPGELTRELVYKILH